MFAAGAEKMVTDFKDYIVFTQMNKKFPVNICPNANAWCNEGDICDICTTDTLVPMHINICDICTTDTLSGSYAYKHL
jgi:hypothetical protein